MVVNYFQSKSKAEAVAAEINALHGERALPVYGDVTVKEDMVRLVGSAEAHFALPVSVVVNNALASYQFNPGSTPHALPLHLISYQHRPLSSEPPIATQAARQRASGRWDGRTSTSK